MWRSRNWYEKERLDRWLKIIMKYCVFMKNCRNLRMIEVRGEKSRKKFVKKKVWLEIIENVIVSD